MTKLHIENGWVLLNGRPGRWNHPPVNQKQSRIKWVTWFEEYVSSLYKSKVGEIHLIRPDSLNILFIRILSHLIRYDMTWYHTIWDKIWYIRYGMIWYNKECYMIWYDMIYDMIWYMIWYMMRCYAMRYDAMRYDTIRYDMIWYDMAWYDVIWHDMMWYNILWYD